MSNKALRTVLVAGTAIPMLLFGAASASADTPTNLGSETSVTSTPEITLEQFAQRLVDLGVDPIAIPGLLEKFKRGELPDSDVGDKEPSSVTTVIQGNDEITRSVYADGSVSVTILPNPVPQESTGLLLMGFGSCASSRTVDMQTVQSGCKASYSAVTWSATFQVRQVSWGIQGAFASGPYNPTAGGIGVTYKSLKVTNGGGANATAAVRILLHQSINLAGVPVERDCGFDLKVTKSGGPRVYSFGE